MIGASASSTRMRFVPEHWTWRDGPVDPGPAVVVDIDGVLSDASTRQHYIEAANLAPGHKVIWDSPPLRRHGIVESKGGTLIIPAVGGH